MAGTEIELLRTIVEQQRRQLDIATEALELQRRHAARADAQFERAERIQARSEVLQARGARVSRIVLLVLVPLIVFIAGLLLTPYLRYWYWMARH